MLANIKTAIAAPAVLTAIVIAFPMAAKAWSCAHPDTSFALDKSTPPSETETLRQASKSFAVLTQMTETDTQVLVVGQFSRNKEVAFFHQNLLTQMRAKYWPPAEDVVMPALTSFSYPGAFRFDGHSITGADLTPFSAPLIDATVSIYASYEGYIEPLPPTNTTVIGLLETGTAHSPFKLQTWICPRYYVITKAQLDDWLKCYKEGECS